MPFHIRTLSSLEALNDLLTRFSFPILILQCTSIDQPCGFVTIIIHKRDTTSLFIYWTCLYAIHVHNPKSLWLRSLCICNKSSRYSYQITSYFRSQYIQIKKWSSLPLQRKVFLLKSTLFTLTFLIFSSKFSSIFFSK